MRELSEEEIEKELEEEYVAGRLRLIVEKAKAHWDALGKPYPKHLQTAIAYLMLHASKASP